MSKAKQFGGSRAMIIIVVVVVIILIVVGSVLGYLYSSHYKSVKTRTVTIIKGLTDGKTPKRISNGTLPKSTIGNEYNIGFWIYVSDYNYRYNEDKCIMYKGKVFNNSPLNNADNTSANHYNQGNPGVWLLKNNNTLRVQLGVETDYHGSKCSYEDTFDNHNSSTSNDLPKVMSSYCDVPLFPLQTWVYVDIALSGNTIDVYLDGDLKKSCILNGHPITSVDDLYVCQNGGFNGYLSNVTYSSAVLSMASIRKTYKKGPSI
jgi:hypothetical protein